MYYGILCKQYLKIYDPQFPKLSDFVQELTIVISNRQSWNISRLIANTKVFTYSGISNITGRVLTEFY